MINEEQQSRGFSGLSALADDVPQSIAAEDSLPKGDQDSVDSPERLSLAGVRSEQEDSSQASKSTSSAGRPNNGQRSSNAVRWIVAIVVFAIVLGIAWQREYGASQLAAKSSQGNEPHMSQTAKSGRREESNFSGFKTESSSGGFQDSLNFEKPPIGRKRILSVSQIIWCEREALRIETLAKWGNNYVEAHNVRVTDYNSRCSEYRYRVGSLSRARKYVANHRAQIVAKLRSKYSKSETNIAKSSPSTEKVSRSLVREIQSRLDEQGFSAGREDGLVGPQTTNAIRSYQQFAHIKVTGAPSVALLNLLRANNL